jgi:hypothetical protein
MGFGRWRAVREWARRYLPAEAAGLLTAAAGALIAHRLTGSAATTAIVASNCEAIGYYGTVGLSDLRRHRRAGGRALQAMLRTMRDLAVEFGPAEVVDSVLVRPALMYAGPILTGHLISGTVAGKVAADVVFYAIAISGYELRTRVLFRESGEVTSGRREIAAPRQRPAP